ncbi:MAG: AMP-binding protein [Bacteroidota bacterium]|nr:AMP-binding protein [Bacteroidota bacterium]
MSYPYQIKSLEEYNAAYKKSVDDPEEFWAEIAGNFLWKKKWDKVLEWNFKEPKVEWFKGAKLNITENCLDRWAKSQPDAPAIIWEPNDPEEQHRVLSYKELLFKVMQFANVLKNNGIKKGDRICIYMPMVPELAIAVLACARIGAIHSVVFGGFSAQSIADRIQDAQCAWVITADGANRGAKQIALKQIMDEALINCPSVKKVIVLKRTGAEVSMNEDRDVWWHDEIEKLSQVSPVGGDLEGAEEMDAEDMLFILYTSGSTGKPKGVVHTCGGYMVYANYTFVNVFQYQPGQIYFCTADVGWITGHSYIIYGPLSAGATSLMFEGIPTWPDAGRFWDIVAKHKVNILYTAPTAIRSLMAYGLDYVKDKNLGSLKVLGTVGEPINEEAWHWYHENIGKGNCPIVDTWWQTETGGIMISNIAGVTPAKPGWATLPMPGVQPILIAPSISPNGGEKAEERHEENREEKKIDQGEFYEDADPMLYGLLKEFAKEHRSNSTDAENILWEQLKGRKFKSYKFRRQHIIGSFITDFICLEKKLVIEVDGLIHQLPDNIISDVERTEWLQSIDYKVIRFTNQEIINNMEDVLLKIDQQLQQLPSAEKKIYNRSQKSPQKSSPYPPPLGEKEGALCIAFPWPGMLRTTYGDHERCRQNYFATYDNLYFTGDGCLRDENGFYRITGRVDDVLNVSGHRIGTAEVENAINMHTGVVESAVVGFPHAIKGQGIYAYVIFNGNHEDENLTRKGIAQTVSRVIGAIAKPDKIQFVNGLPKTRSGKIMRRILRKIAEGETKNLGDTTTLLDPAVVEEIQKGKV